MAKGAFIEGTDDSHKAGDNIDAGLPNITGNFFVETWADILDVNDNAFTCSNYTKIEPTYGNVNRNSRYFYFDASRCSSVYGKSNTVQPKACVSHYWLRVK